MAIPLAINYKICYVKGIYILAEAIVVRFNYALDAGDYSVKNALLWGNCSGHAHKASGSGRLQDRVVHGLIAAVEAIPVVGQIASLFELAIVTKFGDFEARPERPSIRARPASPQSVQASGVRDENRNINNVAAKLLALDETQKRPEYVSFTNTAYTQAYGNGDGFSAWKIHVSVEPEKRDAAWQIMQQACMRTPLKIHGKVHSCKTPDNSILQPGKEFALLIDSTDDTRQWPAFLTELAMEFQKAGILPDPRPFNSLEDEQKLKWDRVIPTHGLLSYFAYRSDLATVMDDELYPDTAQAMIQQEGYSYAANRNIVRHPTDNQRPPIIAKSYFIALPEFRKHNPASLSDPLASTTLSTREVAVGMMRNKQWGALRNFIRDNPSILGQYMQELQWENTLLYAMVSYIDETLECQEVARMIIEGSDWSRQDNIFGNTPLLYAIARGTPSAIALYLAHVEAHPELSAMCTSPNTNTLDANNTPLIMAIKNGYQDIACRLVERYSANDLKHVDKQGQTALQLACYLKLNSVVRAILMRAEALHCKEALLSVRNPLGFTAAQLYRAPFQPYYGDRIWQDDHINRYNEAVMKHNFDYERDSDKVVDEGILASLFEEFRV